ncbi:MAG: CHRD domain-containing protein [Myxococcota bacterium]
MGSTSEIRGTVTYDDVTGLFSWNYNYGDNAPIFDDGLLFGGASETVSHFHRQATPGVPGSVTVGTTPPIGSPNSGSTTITAGQGADLLAELWYLNVHSAICAGGELRGQVLFAATAPVPSASMLTLGFASLAILGAALGLHRRPRRSER